MDFVDFESQRQKKIMSSKVNKQQKDTKHNQQQKERQSCKIFNRSQFEKERQEKQNPDIKQSRTYYCTQCHQTFETPCRCQWLKWCGVDGPFDKCCWYKIIGVEVTISYDELCPWHIIDYERYWNN